MRLDPRRIDVASCAAPTSTDWGTIRCITAAGRCTHQAHRRWDRHRIPMGILWWLKPWWPNAKGRAADRAGRRKARGSA